MPGTNLRRALAVSAIVAASACTSGDDAAQDTVAAGADTAAMSAVGGDTAMGAGTTAAPAGNSAPLAAGALSDPNVFYVLDMANVMDSATGAIAVAKGTNSEVRDFGRMMMRDHHTLRVQGQDLAKRLNITPAPPANDQTQAEMDRAMNTLNGVAKGRDFDKAYIDHEVEMHKRVLETATSAANATQNADLKNLIQKAAPNIQAHLDRAQAIQRTLQ